ncbi:FixH family protein [Draconibacterium sp. IB214405]|uniref:FixH family protein n=1 Tax=Draconibacterium sp. IB214405 TaxID=3097352 RepID=UPI002A17FF7E|nr:FixH family protein [Draconibacterium sp. IB214405]MDX8338373.1 FixH family protein [Draconibacterium sp. IB214405]
MKFNWGTGIFIFLALFLAGSAVFIVFAVRQPVNLVHKDYYEKGVDYSEQMNVNARSKAFAHSFDVALSNDALIVSIDNTLVSKIDSGTMHLFRPSDYTKDLKQKVLAGDQSILFQKADLINGRYILKFSWYTDGERYEIDRPVNIQ